MTGKTRQHLSLHWKKLKHGSSLELLNPCGGRFPNSSFAPLVSVPVIIVRLLLLVLLLMADYDFFPCRL